MWRRSVYLLPSIFLGRFNLLSVNQYYCIKTVPHVINSRALTDEKSCINKAIHTLLMHGNATFNMIVPGPRLYCHYEMCTARPYYERSQWKLLSRDIGEKRNKIVKEITQNVANVFSFYAIIAIVHVFFSCINIRQVPWEV